MRPALTKPTTRTVVTDEDWFTTVTRAPVSAPVAALRVSLVNSIFICSPAAVLRPSVIFSMPYKKSASPPSKPTPMARKLMGFETLSSAAAICGKSKRAVTKAPTSQICRKPLCNPQNPGLNDTAGLDKKPDARFRSSFSHFIKFVGFILILRYGF